MNLNKKETKKNEIEIEPVKILAHYLEIGGTMLGSQCSTCNSPLFRYHGSTFCPVCKESNSVKDNNDESIDNLNHINKGNNLNLKLKEEEIKKYTSKINENQKYTIENDESVKLKVINIIEESIKLSLSENNINTLNKYINIINSCLLIIKKLQ